MLQGASELKRVLGRSVATVLTAGAAVALAVSGAQAAATPGWRVVATYPQVYLQAASATSATNAWAVGGTSCCNLFVTHWNGKRWETIAVPQGVGGAFTNQVTGASAAAMAGGRAMVFVTSEDEELGTSWVDAFEWRAGPGPPGMGSLTRPAPSSPLVLTTSGVSTAGRRRQSTTTGQAGLRSRPR
jgi:hypothetical protein